MISVECSEIPICTYRWKREKSDKPLLPGRKNTSKVQVGALGKRLVGRGGEEAEERRAPMADHTGKVEWEAIMFTTIRFKGRTDAASKGPPSAGSLD